MAGLGETVAYERVNLHRPPFSFVLEYVAGGVKHSVPVYDAYEPFYKSWWPMQRDILYHEWRPAAGLAPSRRGTAGCASTPPVASPWACDSRASPSRGPSRSPSGTFRRP